MNGPIEIFTFSGYNGSLPQEIIALHPNASFIRRNGEVNAWENGDFKAAVKATGKKQVILAGITTDVSSQYLSFTTTFLNTRQ